MRVNPTLGHKRYVVSEDLHPLCPFVSFLLKKNNPERSTSFGHIFNSDVMHACRANKGSN